MKQSYGAKCPVPNCGQNLGTWISFAAAITRVLEHLDMKHGRRPVAIVGVEE